MSEHPPHLDPNAEPVSELDTYLLGPRSLRSWHEWLCTDQRTGEPSGHLAAPGSRYGTDANDCAWHAIAVACVYQEANGPSDAPDESMDWAMGLAVNDSDYVETIVYDNRHAVPHAVKEQVEYFYGSAIYE